MYAAKPKRIMLFGSVKGYVIWLVLWLLLMVCVRRHFLMLFLIAFLVGMALGLLCQAASDSGKTVKVDEGGITYGRSDRQKTIPLDAEMFITDFVSFGPCLQPVRLQTIVVREGGLQKVVSFNWLARSDFKEMCSMLEEARKAGGAGSLPGPEN